MANDEKDFDIFDTLVEQLGEEKAREFLNIDCEYKDWRARARKYKDELIKFKEEQRMGAILEDQWEKISYHEMSREEYYSLGYSPLEILRQCVLGDHITYPPPEILMVIANQFGYYMEQQGRVSLESAFFGDSRGRGVYAKRAPDKNKKIKMYERFDAYSKSAKGSGKTQEEILTELASHPEYLSSISFSGTARSNPFYMLASEAGDWIDTFLRGYRRWKEESA